LFSNVTIFVYRLSKASGTSSPPTAKNCSTPWLLTFSTSEKIQFLNLQNSGHDHHVSATTDKRKQDAVKDGFVAFKVECEQPHLFVYILL
jgi:hypothetical protein